MHKNHLTGSFLRVEPAILLLEVRSGGSRKAKALPGWHRIFALVLVNLMAFAWLAHSQEAVRVGSISGRVIDAATQQPLLGANVAVMGRQLGGSVGEDGRFVIAGVPVGLYRLQISMIGYETAIRPDVVVRSNRITSVQIELDETALGMGEVVVTADYFSAIEEEAVSTVNFNFEEIRRSPGAAGDISRLVQALPSVNMNTDQRNDLIVRGGSPAENLTIIDNIEIPNINHFPTQGASGGPIGLLNTDLIADVTFYAGGFSAEYGDRLSSVIVVDQREGNREEFDGEVNLGMVGAGLILEGPVGRRRGSWILSARRSYLDLIVNAIGTGAVPKYSDVQAMATYDLNPENQLELLAISGFDTIDISPDDEAEDDFVAVATDQYIAGANWRWLWSTKGYAETSLAYTRGDYGVNVLDGETRQVLFNNDSREQKLALRSNWHFALRPGSAVKWGIVARRLFSDFDMFDDAGTNRVNIPEDELQLREEVTATKLGAFASLQQSLGARLSATVGARLEYFDLNEEFDWSPRVSLAGKLDERTTLTAAFGIYYQNLSLSLLVQHPDNRRLENPRADHYVVGLRRRLTPNTLLSVEAYQKNYTESPFDPDDPTILIVDYFADFGTPVPGRLVGGGKAQSRGVEALIQKKLAEDVYGTLSYAYSISQYTDFTGVERNRTFDNRHLVSLIVGYRSSDRFEYSVRWRYAGGRPYTPFDQELSRQLGQAIIQRDRINSERYSAYHRLDLRFDYRKHFENFNLVSFFTVLNTYNRANIFTYYWDSDESRVKRIDQWSFLPVGGFELEF
jgi:hypothetical protein